ncbi:MAG: DNA translocase FtsK 4TM domain-containing protein [Eggerthellaceae bacterium]|nr:DNA translocase FtsK 4TM domain-containing protein [Eggerthellaceae bacterium]
MSRNASSNQSKKGTSATGKTTLKERRGGASQKPQTPAYDESRIFDSRTKRDIAGVVFVVLAIATLMAVVSPSEGLVTTFASKALHVVFGMGCYLMPAFLAAIGITFLIRFKKDRVPTRAAIGLVVIFIAVLGLLGLATPVIFEEDLSILFDYEALVSHGGYIGAGIAWVGLTLFGKAISCVLLVGVIAVGVVIIGFSISKLIEKIRERAEAPAPEAPAQSAPLFARVKRGKSHDIAPSAVSSANTQVISEAAALSSAKTTALAAEEAPKKRRTRTAQAEKPASDSADVTRRLDAAEIAPEALTRKLSRGGVQQSEPVDTKAARPKMKSNQSPQAAPKPQEGFTLPPMSLLASQNGPSEGASEAELEETAELLQETLSDFGIMATVVGWVAGPTVTLFKVDLPAGVRVSRITALNDDIALALAAPGVRIFAPIPGTNFVGIEVPNRTRQTVLLSDVLNDAKEGPLQIAIGKDVEGNSIVTDLAKMPHLLIGGTTGSGKSVSINAMIMSILMRATPAEVRFIMIDPKRVEFTPYNGIPHLYVPVVTEAKEAASALSWGVAEMERRLKLFSKVGARNIGQYNAKAQAEKAAIEQALSAGQEPPEALLGDELPYIVIIIDELADLMMNVGKEVEFSISRIAQLARAAGIHLIVATQRPSTNVVTGLIKANITNRIAFNVASGIDSRVILDTPGAENLIGLGDLLFSKPEYAKPQRIQGCYVSEDEINAVVDMLKEQGEPEYHSEILSTNLITLGDSKPDGSGGSCESDDPLLWEAAEIVVSSRLGSTSNIQRRLKVGYSRAGRIMDQLEEKGVVGPANGSKPREVLVDEMELETLKAFEQNDGAFGSNSEVY